MKQDMFRTNTWMAGVLLALSGATTAQTLPLADASSLALPAATTAAAPSRLGQQTGTIQVAVRLTDAPLALAVGANAKRTGGTMTLAQRQAYMATLKSKQDALMAQIGALGGTELARVGKAYNALIIAADASKLPQIARLPGVSAVRPVVNHEKALTTTVPYAGATALHGLGLTGNGVTIAVLDSGIDYTHRNLGGSGTAVDFTAASAAAAGVAPAALFPSAKVVGGYDFVGENWPNSALLPDPNPIDAGVAAGHGTHVADIAAGASLDGLHKGMAPGAKLYAVKVCSSVSTSCSGTAILQGLDWAMDPRGDLSFVGAADVVNLSLGAGYGQRENPSTEAVSNVVRFGIVASVSAGNSGDRPYILGSPSNSPEAISVAQTAMPNATSVSLVVNSPPAIAGTYTNTNTVDWAPIVAGFSGVLRRGVGTAQLQACTLTDTIDFTGTVALIDRGNCNISVKVANAAAKGAIGVIMANNAAGDAPTFSFGGGAPLVETLVVSQAIGNTLKTVASDAAVVTVNPAVGTALAGSMASTSSRGPNYNFSTIKPEIGAPGASLSAQYGTGTGQTGFGGTSGAAPMVSGAAALLLQQFPTASPPEIKARLMNAANQTVFTNPATLPGQLAPITRIGGGELRVDRSSAVSTGIWDATNPYSVGLSFGTLRASGVHTINKKVAVRNYSAASRVYTISRSFRYADDSASGAVTLSAPATITVPGNSTGAFVLSLRVDAALLPAWNNLRNASQQGTGSLLQAVEFDGYVTVTAGGESASVPWHILPHKSHNTTAPASLALGGAGSGTLATANAGAVLTGATDVFALTGTSPQISTVLPPYGGGQPLIDMKAVGVRPATDGTNLLAQFAIATYGERAHPAYPAEFDVYVDGNNDGIFDAVVYTVENTGFAASGATVVAVQRLNPDGSPNGAPIVRFFASADLNSSNMIMTVRASDLGVTSASQKFNFSVFSFDNYFTGNLTDQVTGMVHTLDTPKFGSSASSLSTPPNASATVTVTDGGAAGAAASPSQTGFLLMHSDAKTGRESDAVTVTP